MNIETLQKRVYQNKLNKGFNVTDVCMEFCCAHAELGEASDAYIYKNKEDVGEELADAMIYILGIAEILKINLSEKITRKMEKNEKRIYSQDTNGVWSKVEGSS